ETFFGVLARGLGGNCRRGGSGITVIAKFAGCERISAGVAADAETDEKIVRNRETVLPADGVLPALLAPVQTVGAGIGGEHAARAKEAEPRIRVARRA